jgi:CbiX
MLKRALVVLLCSAAPALAQPAGREGHPDPRHGGAADWNERVLSLATTLNGPQPVEVAFGMASRPTIQAAVDKLVARGARSIVAVPMFVSSHSSVVTSTAYLLGARKEMPPELKIFAKMNHGPASTGATGHEAHTPA